MLAEQQGPPCACGCFRVVRQPGSPHGRRGFAREACAVANTHARQQAQLALEEYRRSLSALATARGG